MREIHIMETLSIAARKIEHTLTYHEIKTKMKAELWTLTKDTKLTTQYRIHRMKSLKR